MTPDAGPTVTGTPLLNKALAAFQAEMPNVAKGETADAGTYKYRYADLPAITAIASPLLGKNGLAFSSRPTLIDGKFCLTYELLHESGEQKEGVMPLPSSGKPQDLGALLTYYRRYAMCAVCNIALGGEDNDAATANHEQRFDTRSAGAAFDEAVPVAPRSQQRPANGSAVRPQQQDRPAVSPTELDEDAQNYADEAHEANTLASLHDIHVRAREDRKLAALIRNPATGGTGGLGQYLNYRKGLLQKADKALKDYEAAGTALGLAKEDLGAEFEKLEGCSIEAATAEQLDQAAAKLASLTPSVPA